MKLLLACLILFTLGFTQVVESKLDSNGYNVFELLADHVNAEGSIIYANGDVMLLSNDIYALAQNVIYNREKRTISMLGDVKIFKGGSLFAHSESVFLRLDDDYAIVQPFYVQDSSSGMWVGGMRADDRNGVYGFNKATISGCSIERPIWHMNVTSGHYDSNRSILSVWNPTIYLGDVPIFYLPYLRFSTKSNRSTGFLFPDFGSSSNDGFIFTQPFYIAPKSFFDITLSPQFRSERGGGMGLEFRIVDFANDPFIFNVKYLYSKDSYKEFFNLRNNHVFGFDFFHSSRNILQKYFGVKKEVDNGLHIDLLYMNDLDYLRFDRYNAIITDGTRVSKLNLYLNTQNHYYGLNLHYFLNLNKINNDTTFQTLPLLQYHKFLKPLFYKGLLYSIDYQTKNTARTVGFGFVQNSLDVPIGIILPFFHKWINIGVWNKVFISNLGIYNSSSTFIGDGLDNARWGNYLSSTFELSLNMDLGKNYKKFLHVIQLDMNLSIPYLRFSNGLLNSNFLDNPINRIPNEDGTYTINGRVFDDYWNPILINEYNSFFRSLDVKLNQYFYSKTGKELFYWRVRQIFNFDDSFVFYRPPIENKIGFSPISGLDLSGVLSYSFFEKSFQEVSLSTSYIRKHLSAALTYYIKNELLDPINFRQQTTANNLSLSFSNDFGYFGLSASVNLNFNNLAEYNGDLNSIITNWSIGIFKNIRCFAFGLRVASTRTPILVNDFSSQGGIATSVLNNTYLRFDFSFSPLAQSNLTYRFYNR